MNRSTHELVSIVISFICIVICHRPKGWRQLAFSVIASALYISVMETSRFMQQTKDILETTLLPEVYQRRFVLALAYQVIVLLVLGFAGQQYDAKKSAVIKTGAATGLAVAGAISLVLWGILKIFPSAFSPIFGFFLPPVTGFFVFMAVGMWLGVSWLKLKEKRMVIS